MTPKSKLFYKGIPLLLGKRRAKRIAKKIHKFEDDERYPSQWKNDFIVKKGKKFLKFLNIDLSVKGWENIPKQVCLLAPNHASSIDPTALVVALENPGKTVDDFNITSVFLAKKELKKDGFSGYMDILDTFYVDRKNPRDALKQINDMAAFAKKYNRQIVIFPEGTRTEDGEIKDFKAGAFKIAKSAFIPIIPVTINNSFNATNLNKSKRTKLEIIFHKPIKPMQFITSDTASIAKKVKRIVESAYVKPNNDKKIKDFG